jgi:hypothetical protein
MYNFFNSYFTLNKFIYIALSVLLFLVPFTVPFILAFRKFDLHPSQQFNRRYLKVFVPLLLGGFVLSAVIVLNTSQSMKNYNFWYLTSNQKVIESDLDFTRIYDKDKGKIVDLDISFYYGIVDRIESGGYFYTYDYTKNAREYNRINLTTNKVENIYKANRDYFKVSGGGWLYKNTFALFDGSYTRQDISLVLVNLDTRAVIKIKLPDKLQEKYRVMRVFGAVESNGKRSWLVCGEKGIKYPVFRIWEDGSSRELFIKGHLPHYISNILISNANDGMVFYRLNETGVEEIKTDPYGKSVLLFPLEVLESGPRKEVYGQYPGRHGKSLMRIDLEKFTVTKIMDFNGTIIYNNPDECYLLDSHLNPGKVSRVLRDGKLQLLRTFSGYNARAKDNFFQRSRNGIIAKEDGKISIYKFPTLEEIKFKGID